MGPLSELEGILQVLSLLVAVLLLLATVFAGLAIQVHLRTEGRARRWHRLEAAWQPRLLEVIDGDAPPESLHELVAPAHALYFVQYLQRYDRLLGGEERARLRAAVRPYLPRLLPRTRKGTEEERARALQTLARMGMPEHAEVVAGALDDPSPLVAMIAARGLFRPGYATHFPDVLARLDRFQDWQRGYLAGMLANGGPEAAPLLRDLLGDEARPIPIRAAAAETLRALHDLDAVPVAEAVLAAAPDPDLAIPCLRMLADVGHAGHAELVRRYVSADHDAVRSAALQALGSVGGASDKAFLEDHLDDPSTWAALSAGRALLELSGPDDLQALAAGEGRAAQVALQVVVETERR